MDMPGLLPEDGGPRPSRLPWVQGLLVLVFLLVLGLLVVQLVRLRGERNAAQARIEDLLRQIRKPVPAPSAPAEPPSRARRREELESRLAQVESGRRPEPEVPGHAPAAGPRGGRPLEAEAMVYVYVSMEFVRRGLMPEAVRSLEEALRLDPEIFRKVKPRALLGSEEEYRKLLAELEKRVRENPMDADARVVLAYLYLHDPAMGRDQARLLLTQAVGANPDHAVARKLMESLEK